MGIIITAAIAGNRRITVECLAKPIDSFHPAIKSDDI